MVFLFIRRSDKTELKIRFKDRTEENIKFRINYNNYNNGLKEKNKANI